MYLHKVSLLSVQINGTVYWNILVNNTAMLRLSKAQSALYMHYVRTVILDAIIGDIIIVDL